MAQPSKSHKTSGTSTCAWHGHCSLHSMVTQKQASSQQHLLITKVPQKGQRATAGEHLSSSSSSCYFSPHYPVQTCRELAAPPQILKTPYVSIWYCAQDCFLSSGKMSSFWTESIQLQRDFFCMFLVEAELFAVASVSTKRGKKKPQTNKNWMHSSILLSMKYWVHHFL